MKTRGDVKVKTNLLAIEIRGETVMMMITKGDDGCGSQMGLLIDFVNGCIL